jgi:hypothetical protein
MHCCRKALPLVLLLFCSLPTLAEKGVVFGGYQLTRYGSQGSRPSGWNAAVTGNVLPLVGITADFGGTYDSRTSTNTYTYTFGPEVHVRALGLKPFAHALFGGATFSQFGVRSTGFTTFLGGGVDIKVLPFVSARLVQVDWMTTRFNGVTHKNLTRFSAGLVLRF